VAAHEDEELSSNCHTNADDDGDNDGLLSALKVFVFGSF
jgi:hypothetical protein